MVCAVFTSPRPPQVGQGSHSTWARDSRVRLRVISTRPSEVKPLTEILVWSRDSALFSSASTCVRCSSLSMSMKSIDDDAAQVAQPQVAGDGLGASRLVLKMVSSKLRAPTKPPVFTSMVVIASVWSMIR
jgi:hypothetical protein